jgi:prepilin-type N-terminal cleavage/methylation domain-containing protein
MTRTHLKDSKQRGFSLLEMLVAMVVLSLMMVFLFNIVAQTIKGWEIGARRVETAFAARVGLDYMARELQASFAGAAVARQTEGNLAEVTNVAPFLVLGPNANLPGGEASRWRAAPDSQKIFSVAPHTSHTNFPGEVGFFCARITDRNGYFEMPFDSYFLVMHRVRYTAASATFFFRNQPDNTWVNRGVFNPLIPNCYRLQLAFFTNNNAGVLTPVNGDWTATDALPAGVVATISVMDAKTAARVRQLGGVNTNDATIRAVLQQGTVEMSRFIPFTTSKN